MWRGALPLGMTTRWLMLPLAAWLCAPAFGAQSVHDLRAQYRFSCAQCHGVAGDARGPGGSWLPGRVLADRRWLGKQKDEVLVASILNGKGAMPSFRFKLTEEAAKRLVAEIIRPMARRAR